MLLGFSYLSKAQCTLPYKSLSQFNNDTTAFINYNFSERSACYVGKTLNDVLQDLKIPIQSFINIPLWHYPDIYYAIYIYIYPYNVVRRRTQHKNYANIIAIGWSTNLSAIDIDSLKDQSNHYKWTPKIENLLESRVIKDIGIVK